MANSDFWSEFKKMMADPEQRKVLMENFERFRVDHDAEKKPIRVAVISYYKYFLNLMEHAECTIDRNVITVGKRLTLHHCSTDGDVYGIEFDYFIVYAPAGLSLTHSIHEAALYMAGFNVPKIDLLELYELMRKHAKTTNQHA